MTSLRSPQIPNQLPKPWNWDDMDLTLQLAGEIPIGHVLTGKKLTSIARRQDNDDVLFEIENDEFKYAIVHLTWASKRSTDENFPATKLYKDWNDLYTHRILVDSGEWED
jgi:hypothetical protein